MNRKLKYFILTAILFLSGFLYSCRDNMKFEQAGWMQKDDIGGYPNRDNMLLDLTENYKLKGLSCRQLKYLLGYPENYLDCDSNTFCYNIVTKYRHDIDPTYIKTLNVSFNVDSIVTDFKVYEYKQNI